MRRPCFTNRFKKDVKRQGRRGKTLARFSELIDFICESGAAPEKYKPHNLTADWRGYRECHIEPDWLLIFTVEKETVTFYRTGTHSDLFR